MQNVNFIINILIKKVITISLNIGEAGDFIKFDFFILIAYGLYWIISKGTFDANYSSGYKGISNFFLFMNLFGIFL